MSGVLRQEIEHDDQGEGVQDSARPALVYRAEPLANWH